MNPAVEKLFYGLSIFVLGMALFIMQSSRVPSTSLLQSQVKDQFAQAWKQVIGDQPYFDGFSLVYNGTESFYNQSAKAAISMVQQSDSDQTLAYVFKTTYLDLILAVKGIHLGGRVSLAQATPNSPPATALEKFMTQAAIDNIIPEDRNNELGIRNKGDENPNSLFIIPDSNQGQVAGASVGSDNPMNSVSQPWVTLRDNFTGQVYCLAVYNGEVNKYLGPCQNDYY